MKRSPSRAPSPTPKALARRAIYGDLKGVRAVPTIDYRQVSKTHYGEFGIYLASYLAAAPPNYRSVARSKLTSLTIQQFHELSTDAYDELVRRDKENEVPFLPIREEFHPKRNQARQKLATLPTNRFKDLTSDVHFDLARRYPEFKDRHFSGEPTREDRYRGGSTTSNYDDYPAPDFPSNGVQRRNTDSRASGRTSSDREQPSDNEYGESVSGRKAPVYRREAEFNAGRRGEDTFRRPNDAYSGRSGDEESFSVALASRRNPSPDITRKSEDPERKFSRRPGRAANIAVDSTRTVNNAAPAQSTTATSAVIIPNINTMEEEHIDIPYCREAPESGMIDDRAAGDNARDLVGEGEPADSASEYSPMSSGSPPAGPTGLCAPLKDVEDDDEIAPGSRSGDDLYDKYGRSSVDSTRSAAGINARMMNGRSSVIEDTKKIRNNNEYKIGTTQPQINTVQRDLSEAAENERSRQLSKRQLQQLQKMEELYQERVISRQASTDLDDGLPSAIPPRTNGREERAGQLDEELKRLRQTDLPEQSTTASKKVAQNTSNDHKPTFLRGGEVDILDPSLNVINDEEILELNVTMDPFTNPVSASNSVKESLPDDHNATPLPLSGVVDVGTKGGVPDFFTDTMEYKPPPARKQLLPFLEQHVPAQVFTPNSDNSDNNFLSVSTQSISTIAKGSSESLAPVRTGNYMNTQQSYNTTTENHYNSHNDNSQLQIMNPRYGSEFWTVHVNSLPAEDVPRPSPTPQMPSPHPQVISQPQTSIYPMPIHQPPIPASSALITASLGPSRRVRTLGMIATEGRIEALEIVKKKLAKVRACEFNDPLFFLEAAATTAMKILHQVEAVVNHDIGRNIVGVALDSHAVVYITIHTCETCIMSQEERFRAMNKVKDLSKLLEHIFDLVVTTLARGLVKKYLLLRKDTSAVLQFREALVAWLAKFHNHSPEEIFEIHHVLQKVLSGADVYCRPKFPPQSTPSTSPSVTHASDTSVADAPAADVIPSLTISDGYTI